MAEDVRIVIDETIKLLEPEVLLEAEKDEDVYNLINDKVEINIK